MIALDNIKELSLDDKLSMMEVLWQSILPHENQLAIPQWHKDILEEREHLLCQGKARFIDWEIAQKQIKEAIHEN